MNNAELLLDSLTDEGIDKYTADYETEEHITIGKDRNITVPKSLRKIAVQFDHNIETVTFDCPRYWDGNDMSKMKVYIIYMRSDGKKGRYMATNIVADKSNNDVFHFDWTISRNVTEVKGNISFLVCIRDANDINVQKHWNSNINTEMVIGEGMECGVLDEPIQPDIMFQLLQLVDKKLDKNGHVPNKYLGTDGAGNVIEKEEPTGGTSTTVESITTSEIDEIMKG